MNQKQIQEKINGKLILSAGKPAILILKNGRITAEVSGDTPEPAKNQGLTRERLYKQLSKMGETPFALDELEIDMKEPVFLPVQSINELRRLGIAALTEASLKEYRRSCQKRKQEIVVSAESAGSKERSMVFTASVQTQEQFLALLSVAGIQRLYLDCEVFTELFSFEKAQQAVETAHASGKECWLILPRIFRLDIQKSWDASGMGGILKLFDGFLVRNLEAYSYLLKKGISQKELLLDNWFYVFNREAEAFWREQQIWQFTAPFEENARELQEKGSRKRRTSRIWQDSPDGKCPVLPENIRTLYENTGSSGVKRSERCGISGTKQLQLLSEYYLQQHAAESSGK